MIEIVTALIGLVGTIAVAYLGYRQWQRSRGDSGRAEVTRTRREKYESLWRLVEKIHVDLRRDPENLRRLEPRVAEVNAFILENEIYLADDDHLLVNRYLAALREMIEWAGSKADDATKAQVAITGSIPREATAVIRAEQLRDELKKRVRKALGEES